MQILSHPLAGIFERTKALALNPSRLSPRGSDIRCFAISGLTGEQIAQSSAIATQLFATPGLEAKEKTALELVKALKSHRRQPPWQIYGVTFGGLFRITPHFDPSGRALRFTLGHLPTNRVPDAGSVDLYHELHAGPSGMPRGGIPRLNEIPGIRNLQVLRYFVKREGTAAPVQHSMVFLQSTIYPATDDRLILLSPLRLRADLGGK